MAPQGDNPILRVLSKVSIRDIVGSKKPFLLKDSQTLDSCLAALSERKLISAPVVNGSGKFVGVLDVQSVLDFLVAKSAGKDVLDVDFSKSTAIDVVDSSSCFMSAVIPLDKSAPASTLLEAFATSRVQRAIIYDTTAPENSLVCSITDIVRFLHNYSKVTDDVGLKTLLGAKLEGSGLYIPGKPIITVGESSTVLDAIKLLEKEKISAAAIVEDDSKSGPILKGTFSASDLRCFRAEEASALKESVRTFLLPRSPTSIVVGRGTLSGKGDATIRDWLQLVSEEHLHRVWITEPSGSGQKVVGVISLGDFASWAWSIKTSLKIEFS